MTKQISKKSKVQKAFRLHQELIQLGRSVQKAFILIGKNLYEIQENNLFKHLGDGGYETFNMYLASPELELSRRQAFYLIKVYRIYCKNFGASLEQMEGAKLSALKVTLPVVTQENYEEWLEKTKVLSLSDVRAEVKREELGKDPMDCEHEWEKRIFFQCSECGERQWGPIKPND